MSSAAEMAFRSDVEAALVRGGIAPDVAVGQASDLARETTTLLGRGTQFLNPRLRWAIRDEDLKLLEALAKAAALFVAGTALTSAATFLAALVPIFLLVRRANRRGAKLDERQCLLLLALRSRDGGMTISEVNRVLRAVGHDLGEVAVVKTLEELQDFRVADGDVVALVKRDAHGRWAAAAV